MTDSKELVQSEQMDGKTLLALITSGDMGGLDPERKMAYYKSRCEAAGLDPRTAPFQFIRLQGKETLYATKGATDQLARNHKIRLHVVSQETAGDIRVVMVRATTGDGRETDEMGAVPIMGLKGADLANAYMKAITKAKRRAVLSLCGLGMMDETELETIPGVAPAPMVRMPEPIGPAEPDPIEPLPLEPEPVAPMIGLDVPAQEISDVLVKPTRIIPEKKASGGFIYTVYTESAGPFVSESKPDALEIKKAVDSKTPIKLMLEGNRIVGIGLPF